MKAIQPKAEKSALLTLAAVLVISVIVVAASKGIVRTEILGVKHDISNVLGLSVLEFSGRRLLSRISKLPKAVHEGRYPPVIDSLDIDVRFADLQIIREDRLKALEHPPKLLTDPREVNAIVRYGGDVYRANIRLKGDFPAHWREQTRWSFRVELKDGASIWGMSEFSIHKPAERQFPFDQTFQEIVRIAGNLSPRQTFFKVRFNGEDWGVMNAEEHVSKNLLELQGRKESIIAKFGNNENLWIYQRLNEESALPYVRYGTLREMQPYDGKSVVADQNLLRLYSYLNKAILGYIDGQYRYVDVFDTDAYSRALLAAMVWNNIHTLGNPNARHYLNPYTLRLEPITTDQLPASPLTLDPPDKFAFTATGVMSSDLIPEPFLDLLFVDDFWHNLDANLDIVLNAFSEVPAVFESLEQFFPLERFENPSSITSQNIEYLNDRAVPFLRRLAERRLIEEDRSHVTCCDRQLNFEASPRYSEEESTIEAFEGVYPQHLIARHYSDGTLEIENLLLEPVDLLAIRLAIADELRELRIPKLVVPPSTSAEPTIIRVPLPIDRLQPEQRLVIESEVDGSQKSLVVSGTLDPTVRNPLLAESSIDYLLETYPFFLFEAGGLRVKKGTWTISEPIVLPGMVALSIGPATTLQFCTDCYIVVKGPIQLGGTKTDPVKLLPQDRDWKGLYVLEADGESRIVHAEIAGASEVSDSALALTGGVVFYRSDITMDNVRIVDAYGEDALNIVQSKFSLQDILICSTRSDGLDIDFSEGKIQRSTFCEIGGDALDMSGSVVRAEDLVAHDVHDKAVSAGERTQLSLAGARIERVGTGVVSKDSSTVEASELIVREHQLFAAMVYQKKSFYGPSAVLSLQRVVVDDTAEPFLAQTGSELRVDGRLIPTTVIDVDALYTTGPMKK